MNRPSCSGLSCLRVLIPMLCALWALPLPWIAAELGWFIAEHGRQPWAIEGVLPTFLAVSPIAVRDVAISLSGFVVFYTALAAVDVFLLRKYVRLGPARQGPALPEGGGARRLVPAGRAG